MGKWQAQQARRGRERQAREAALEAAYERRRAPIKAAIQAAIDRGDMEEAIRLAARQPDETTR